MCAVAGLATNFCVITTVMDALCHDFRVVLLDDCTATWSRKMHENLLSNYRRNSLDPLLRVLSQHQLAEELGIG